MYYNIITVRQTKGKAQKTERIMIMFYYITIENPVTETKTTKEFNSEAEAIKAYDEACKDDNNYVRMFRERTGSELTDTFVKSNY